MAEDTVDYRFEVPRELWDDWKNTFPRDKPIDQRLIELIREDTHE